MYQPAYTKDPQMNIELQRIAESMNGPTELLVLYAAPAKPRTGWLVYADGISWNPGGGAGVYVYTGAVWSKL
jgi:hypothetical protein